jgi:hypothetical protein
MAVLLALNAGLGVIGSGLVQVVQREPSRHGDVPDEANLPHQYQWHHVPRPCSNISHSGLGDTAIS